jgi:hypothetical protein
MSVNMFLPVVPSPSRYMCVNPKVILSSKSATCGNVRRSLESGPFELELPNCRAFLQMSHVLKARKTVYYFGVRIGWPKPCPQWGASRNHTVFPGFGLTDVRYSFWKMKTTES